MSHTNLDIYESELGMATEQRSRERQMLNMKICDKKRKKWAKDKTNVIDVLNHITKLKCIFAIICSFDVLLMSIFHDNRVHEGPLISA